MKKFILRNIWTIRIVWVTSIVLIFCFGDPRIWWVSMGQVVNIMIGLVFLTNPNFFLGPLEESVTQPSSRTQEKGVDVNHVSEHMEKEFVFPEPSSEDLKLREEVFDQVDQARERCTLALKAANDAYKTEVNTAVERILSQLRMRVPPGILLEKVDKCFAFSDADSKRTHDLRSLYIEGMGRVIGICVLRNLPFNKEELEKLNGLWYPFVFIHPQINHIFVFPSERKAQEMVKGMEDLLAVAKQVQEEHSKK